MHEVPSASPTRRQFFGSIALPALSAPILGSLAARTASAAPLDPARLASLFAALAVDSRSPEDAARDEDLWREVQQAFTVDRSIMNLNNGGVSPSPRIVQEAMKRHLDYSNTATAYTMWRIQEPQRETVRQRLAKEWSVDPEELAITRNSSESLETCQYGLNLRAGDEVLTTTHDYPRMITTFKQRARREGIVLRQFKIPVPCEDSKTIVRLFEENITERTRVILMCHIVNITGQILPVREVVAMARARNIPVIVDGAHALAHFDFKLSDLDCDYYGVSLHKWLFAPHGTGLLYVRKDKIQPLWPLMAAGPELDANIRKFEEIGTHPAANFLAIAEALSFHQGIGGARKEARLRYLRNRWAKRLLTYSDRVRLHTSLKDRFSCAIATVQVDGLDTAKLADWLFNQYKIFTVAIIHDEFNGLRITPSVYTTLEEIDRFGDAMEHAITKGLPA